MSGIPQFRAAEVAGRLVAQGLLAEAEVLPPIVAAALNNAPPHKTAGADLRAALLRRYAAARDLMASDRRRATWLVRQALAPLVEQYAARTTLLAAAATADRRRALLAHERRRIAEALVRQALARRAMVSATVTRGRRA